jgi:hypothetical protein
MTGAAFVGSAELGYVDVSTNDVARRLRRLQDRDQDFVCLADNHEHALTPEALTALLERWFAFYLPVPAPWEA